MRHTEVPNLRDYVADEGDMADALAQLIDLAEDTGGMVNFERALEAARQRVAQPRRYAYIEFRSGRTPDLNVVERYMPSNYSVRREGRGYLIEGRDDHGWTLDGYVIPRLASGLMFATESDRWGKPLPLKS